MGIVHGAAVFRGMNTHNYQLFWCEDHGVHGPCQVDRAQVQVLQVLQAQVSGEIETPGLPYLRRWFFYSVIGNCQAMWLPFVPESHMAGPAFDGFPMMSPCRGWRRGTWTSWGVISIIIPAWAQAGSNFYFSAAFEDKKDLAGTVHWTVDIYWFKTLTLGFVRTDLESFPRPAWGFTRLWSFQSSHSWTKEATWLRLPGKLCHFTENHDEEFGVLHLWVFKA